MPALSHSVPILATLRSRNRQEAGTMMGRILQRLAGDATFAPRLTRYGYSSMHSRQSKLVPLEWTHLARALSDTLRDEPRATLRLVEGERSYDALSLYARLNCGDEMVQERVDGRSRTVPVASDSSTISLSANGSCFAEASFTTSYLDLAADLFELFAGTYGSVSHLAVEHGNDYDRVHRDPVEPSFIAWANLFGPELVSRLGRERLQSSPAYLVRELAAGSVLLTVAASPMEELDPAVQETIARVEAHLGIVSPSMRAGPEAVAAFDARSAARQKEMHRRIEAAFGRAPADTGAEMKRQADGCAQGAAKFWGVRLDFRPDSLAAVDHIIVTKFAADEDGDTIATAVQAFGAYVGEVVRQNCGGIWRDEDMNGRPVLAVGTAQKRVDPFAAVRQRFGEPKVGSMVGRVLGGHQVLSRLITSGFTLANWYQSVCHESR